jgi:hypothetical protein
MKYLALIIALALTGSAYGAELSECKKAWLSRLISKMEHPERVHDLTDIVAEDCIPECDGGCWIGYVHDKGTNRFKEVTFGRFTRALCTEQVRAQLDINPDKYENPSGCYYIAKELTWARIYNKLSDFFGGHIYCIAKRDDEFYYTIILKGWTEGERDAHCVEKF